MRCVFLMALLPAFFSANNSGIVIFGVYYEACINILALYE